MIIANDKRTFAQLVDDAYLAARVKAAPFAPTRAEVEAELAKVGEHLEALDAPEQFIKATFRNGHWDAVAVQLWRAARINDRSTFKGPRK